MSRGYVQGRGFRDIWTIDAIMEGGSSETSGLAIQIVWDVVQKCLHSTQLWWAGVQRQIVLATLRIYIHMRRCGMCGLAISALVVPCNALDVCLIMLELNFHSESFIYSSQWFALLVSHTSLSDSYVIYSPLFLSFVCRWTWRVVGYLKGLVFWDRGDFISVLINVLYDFSIWFILAIIF